MNLRDRSLITGEGGGLVQKRGGSDIFVLKKGGGQKFLCNIDTYLSGVTLPYHKTNNKNREKQNLAVQNNTIH